MPGSLTFDISEPTTIALLAVIAVSVVTDLRRRRIYDALTVPAGAAGIVLNGTAHGGAGVLFAVIGLLCGAALFAPMVALLGRGAGDLKLLAVVGAFGGPSLAFWTALWAGVAGGAVALAVLMAGRCLGPVLAGMAQDVGAAQFPVARSNICLPYAVPIAAGVLIALALA